MGAVAKTRQPVIYDAIRQSKAIVYAIATDKVSVEKETVTIAICLAVDPTEQSETVITHDKRKYEVVEILEIALRRSVVESAEGLKEGLPWSVNSSLLLKGLVGSNILGVSADKWCNL